MRAATVSFVLALTVSVHAQSASRKTLDIYWIDVEGGAATLIVAPTGESLLVDTGFPGNGDRDAKRIVAAMQDAKLDHLDNLFITHYHIDHVGGVPGLAKLTTIRHFYDHGDNTEPGGAAAYESYLALAKDKRTILKPGDKFTLGDVKFDVVSAAGTVIDKPLNRGASKNFCEGAETKPTDMTENSKSAGFLMTFGRFSFLDVGDLTWDREMMLACPANKIGEITLLQATHHGFSNGQSGNPALIFSLHPQVVVVNNGGRKGFSNGAYDTIAKIPDIRGIWQGHTGEQNDAAHNTTADMIANLSTTGDEGHWIKASIAPGGAPFTVTNGRNGFSQTYNAR